MYGRERQKTAPRRDPLGEFGYAGCKIPKARRQPREATFEETAFAIIKVGFEQFGATSARQNGLTYGLVTAAMTLMSGWIAPIVFRKD